MDPLTEGKSGSIERGQGGSLEREPEVNLMTDDMCRSTNRGIEWI